jgi:2-keto-4-pentenoate hydratase
VSLPAWEDPRIAAGMTQQLNLRREFLRAGREPLGWKLAFGGPAAMQRLRINEPLVGFLMADALVPSGSALSLNGWTKPAAEPEITVYMHRDLAAGADRETTIAAIGALGAAIEVADVDHTSDDVEGTLARNIYQRHLVLGQRNNSYAGGGLRGLNARVAVNTQEIADTLDLEALTGELIHVVTHVATLLTHFGETLRAGDIIIAGSITPPLWVQPGDHVSFQLEPFDRISIEFAPKSDAT